MMRPTHRIYLCNVNFSKTASSSDEKKLRNTSIVYNNIYTKRKHALDTVWSGFNCNDFIGVVNYIPEFYGGDITKASDILLYLYKGKAIVSHAYKSCIECITRFININNISSIQLSGDDVARLNINNIDIINDIKNKVNHELDIVVTRKIYTSNGYHLI